MFLLLSLALFVYSAPVEVPLPGLYFPKNEVKSFDTNCSTQNTVSEAQQTAVAQDFLAKRVSGESIITDEFVGPTSGIMYFKASAAIGGVVVANTQMSINVDKCGNVVSFAKAWIPKSTQLSKRELSSQLSGKDALIAFASRMGFAIDQDKLTEAPGNVAGSTLISGASFASEPVFAAPAYFTTKSNGVKKAMELRVNMNGPDYFNAFISQSDSSLLALTNFASSSLLSSRSFKENRNKHLVKRQNDGISYTVVPLPNTDLSKGSKVLTDQQLVDPTASPLGWHRVQEGDQPLNTLMGNNVIAQENSANSEDPVTTGKRPVSPDFKFEFKVDDVNQQPAEYFEASVTNMFVQSNVFHDTMFKYGFNEKAGGKGNDAVVANAQDGSSLNNANFASPPDGQPGVMRMFLFDSVPQGRDGALDNGVIIHELAHGLSTRLTGGPNSGICLSSLESGGLGEGWSDFVAFAMLQSAKNTRKDDFPIGAYVTNNKFKGVRTFPYSTSLETNPRSFNDLTDPKNLEVHIIGEVWAAMLIEVYWNMVEKLGFSANLSDAASGKGNTELMQLVVDGMRTQPCNPTFLQARDAIIQADQARNNGANLCEIAKGFAKRGLGLNADDNSLANDFTVPANCE